MRIDFKNLMKKFGQNDQKPTKRAKSEKPTKKWAKNIAIAMLLMGGGAGANELLSNDKEVEALDKQNAIVAEEVETSTEDVAIVTEETADVEENAEISEEVTSTVTDPTSVVRSVQTVTNPITAKSSVVQGFTSVKKVATPVAAASNTISSVTKKASTTATTVSSTTKVDKTEVKVSEKPVVKVPETTKDTATPVKTETNPVDSVVKKPTTTTLSFIQLDGKKVNVEFEGNADDFSGMFIFKDGKWVALNKEESLKVNPYQNLNWTRNNLIVQAIEWERQGASKEAAWNKYYEFEAKSTPEDYEVVNGYTRPNKKYFAQLVSSSLSAAKEALAKGDTFTTGEWLRNAGEHLDSYYKAPGLEVKISGLENGTVPNLLGQDKTNSKAEIVEMLRPDGVKVFVHADFVNENLARGYKLVTPVATTPVVSIPETTTPVATVPETTTPVVKEPVVKVPETTTPVVKEPIATKPVEKPVKKPVVTEDTSKGKSEDMKPETIVTEKSEQTVSKDVENDKTSETTTPVVEKEEPIGKILITDKVIKISEDASKGQSEDLNI